MPFIIAVILVHILSAVSFSQTGEVLREVKGQVIRSTHMPAVELEFGKDFKYAGGHKFVLYEVYRDANAPAKHKETAHYNAWVEKVSDMFAEPRTRAFYTNVFPADAEW